MLGLGNQREPRSKGLFWPFVVEIRFQGRSSEVGVRFT